VSIFGIVFSVFLPILKLFLGIAGGNREKAYEAVEVAVDRERLAALAHYRRM
jgi:hypothetical protein